MRKAEIDYILTTMLEAFGNISDLNITVGKPFQVESSGELTGVPLVPPIDKLTPFQAEIFALNLINSDRRLTEILLREGSCDCSYFLVGKARFRVNIFSQRGNYTIVLRKLETRIPSIEDLKLPPQFAKAAEEKKWTDFSDRGDW
jgi:twitching motility protein PilT